MLQFVKGGTGIRYIIDAFIRRKKLIYYEQLGSSI